MKSVPAVTDIETGKNDPSRKYVAAPYDGGHRCINYPIVKEIEQTLPVSKD